MRIRSEYLARIQVVVAIAYLCFFAVSNSFDELVSNPPLLGAALLAFGVAQLDAARGTLQIGSKPVLRPQFALLDLLVGTAMIAIVVAIGRVRVEIDLRILDYGELAIPTLMTIWFHWRHKLSPALAGFAHYVISLLFVLIYGFSYHHQFNEVYGDDARVISIPIWSDTFDWVQQMAELGLLTSSIYFAAAWLIANLRNGHRDLTNAKMSVNGNADTAATRG